MTSTSPRVAASPQSICAWVAGTSCYKAPTTFPSSSIILMSHLGRPSKAEGIRTPCSTKKHPRALCSSVSSRRNDLSAFIPFSSDIRASPEDGFIADCSSTTRSSTLSSRFCTWFLLWIVSVRDACGLAYYSCTSTQLVSRDENLEMKSGWMFTLRTCSLATWGAERSLCKCVLVSSGRSQTYKTIYDKNEVKIMQKVVRAGVLVHSFNKTTRHNMVGI